MRSKLKKGYIQVYTGNGKGKTTAALGLSLRSWGQDYKVCIIQFMKKNVNYGEYKASLKLGRRFVIKQFGSGRFIKGKPSIKDKLLTQRGLEFAKMIIKKGTYDIVVLDEVNYALKWKLFGDTEIKKLLKIKPDHVELVFTGRYAPGWLLKKADLVTEMKDVKHYFSKKVFARKGVEY